MALFPVRVPYPGGRCVADRPCKKYESLSRFGKPYSDRLRLPAQSQVR